MIRRRLPWLVALVVAVALTAWSYTHYYPALPNPLALEIELPEGRAEQAEPLVSAGWLGNADFLYVRWTDPGTIVIGYDSWGAGGPTSVPLKVTAGTRHRLEIQMPALDQMYARDPFPSSNRLRVTFDGVVRIDADVQHYLRDRDAIWMGENPIGGSSASARFSGRIHRPGEQREWRGSVRELFTNAERHAAWRRRCGWQVVAIAVLFAGAALVSRRSRGRRTTGTLPVRGCSESDHGPLSRFLALVAQHRWFIGSASVGALVFAWMVTGTTFRFNYPENFGHFFDFQAASLLQGRLDVPAEGIGNEAFIFRGKHYGYFGVTPALLRLPFVLFDVGFGRLSRTLMLLEFAGCLAAAYLVLGTIVRLARGPEARPGRFAVAIIVLNTGLGSTLFFLGSRAYIYHEAILCGAMFALFAAWSGLRHLAAPDGRWWIGALVCGLLSVHARPPAGLFALTLLGCVAAIHAWKNRPRAGRHAAIAMAAIGGILSFNAVSYLKFRTFEGAPLRLNVQYGKGRIARIEGKNFHLVNLPFNFRTYVLRPNLHFERHFPWVRMGESKPSPDFPATKSDFSEPVLAFPQAMPVLFLLATVGSLFAWRLAPPMRDAIRATWFGVVPMALAMFTAVATVHRYTADFCPFLITAAAFGLAAIPSIGPRCAAALRAGLVMATCWAILLTVGLTWRYEGEIIWGVQDEARTNYDYWRERIDRFFGT